MKLGCNVGTGHPSKPKMGERKGLNVLVRGRESFKVNTGQPSKTDNGCTELTERVNLTKKAGKRQ